MILKSKKVYVTIRKEISSFKNHLPAVCKSIAAFHNNCLALTLFSVHYFAALHNFVNFLFSTTWLKTAISRKSSVVYMSDVYQTFAYECHFLPAGRKPNMTNTQQEHINKHFGKTICICTSSELTI